MGTLTVLCVACVALFSSDCIAVPAATKRGMPRQNGQGEGCGQMAPVRCATVTPRSLQRAIGCIPQQEFCKTLAAMTVQLNADCDPDVDIRRFVPLILQAFIGYNCPIPSALINGQTLGLLPFDVIKKAFRAMDKEQFMQLLQSLSGADIARLMRTADCRIWGFVATVAAEKGIDLSFLVTNLEFFPILPEEGCKQLPAALLLHQLDAIGRLPFDCRSDHQQARDHKREQNRPKGPSHLQGNMGPPKCKFTCGRIIMKTLFAAANLTQEQLVKIKNLHGCMNKDNIKALAEQGECSAVSGRMVSQLSRKAGQRMVRACAPAVNSSELTTQQLQGMGCLVTGMPLRKLETIPQLVLCTVIADLVDCVTRRTRQAVTKFLARTLGSCAGDDADAADTAARKLGKWVALAGPRAIRKMTKETIMAMVASIREGIADIKGAGKRLQAIKAAANFADKLDLKDIADIVAFMRTVELGRMSSATDTATLKTLLDMDHKVPQMSAMQNRFAFALIRKGRQGAFEPSDFTGLGSIRAGISRSELEKLAAQNNRHEIAMELVDEMGYGSKQAQAVAALWLAGLRSLNETHPLSALTPEYLLITSPKVLQYILSSVVDESGALCTAICEKISASPNLMCDTSVKQRRSLLAACVKCVGADTSLAERTFTAANVFVLRGLLLDADSGFTDNLLTAAEKSPDFRDILLSAFPCRRMRCMTKATRDRVLRLLLQAVKAGVEVTEDCRLRTMDAGSDDVEMLEAAVDDAEEDDESKCCRADRTADDNADFDRGMAADMEKAVAIVQKSAVGGDIRRKRSTVALTCADINTMAGAVQSLSIAALQAMSDDEFYSCVSRFGLYSGWSSQQYVALIDRVRALAPGAVICQMSSLKLQELGSLAYGLLTVDIQCMEHLDVDAMTLIGVLLSFIMSQLEALIKRFMQLEGISANQLSSDNLNVVGHALCGLTEAEIKSISPQQYVLSSGMIGQLMSCGRTQLKSLAWVAKQAGAHGPAAGWSPAVISSVGIVLGGLTGDELKSHGADQIEAWTTNGIRNIAGSELKALSDAQLESLSREQATAITEQQLSQLSEQQRNIIGVLATSTTTATPTTTTARTAAASTMQTSLLLSAAIFVYYTM